MVQQAAGIVTQLLGLAAMAAVLAAVLGLSYRWYTGTAVPQWLAAAVGVAGVAVYFGTTAALEAVIREGIEPTEVEIALFNLGALLAGAGGAVLGRQVGDRFGTDVLLWSPTQDASDVSQFAQTVGRVTTVELPGTIEDASGYDPVPERTKETLAGKRLVFPRGLTVEELKQRLTMRLKSDYGVGTVDVEFDDEGAVRHLAVGTRAAGIGATLPPATNAIAVKADPGFSASTGDIVQLWQTEPMQRVLTGELRGVADDVVTVAVDAGDTPKVDPTKRHRLVTLPVNDRPDREFASLLRAAEETFSTVTVEAGSPLHGLVVGALDLTITAIRPEDGEAVPFPEPTYRLAPGDLLFVIARPGAIRRLEAAATPLDPAVAESSRPADESEPSESIATADEEESERAEPTGEDGLPATQEESAGAGEISADEPATPDAETVADSAEAGAVADSPSTEKSEPAVTGKADTDTFKEIKAQFDEAETVEGEAASAEASADTTGERTERADTEEPSFDQLKSEFESGEADWEDETVSPTEADDEGATAESENDSIGGSGETADTEADVEIAFGAEESSSTEASNEEGKASEVDDDVEVAFSDETEDELVSLEEANITFEDEIAADEETDATDEAGENGEETLGGLEDVEIDEELQGEEDDSIADDIGDLEFEEEPSDDLGELSFDSDEESGGGMEDSADGNGGDDQDDEADDQDDKADDEEEDSGSSGGGGSFAELKEEFESGEADWEDDISDSPGGDMRLDE